MSEYQQNSGNSVAIAETIGHITDINTELWLKINVFMTIREKGRKISYNEFIAFNELVYERCQELRDQDYIDIMKCIGTLLPYVSKECYCVVGSNNLCCAGIDDFIYCQNNTEWVSRMPGVEFIKFVRNRPSYSYTDFQEFLANYCVEPLEIKIGINPEMIGKEHILKNYIGVFDNLQTLCKTRNICSVSTSILIIMLYKFCLENISPDWGELTQDIRVFFVSFYNKCIDLECECVNPSCGQRQLILGWTDCPFKIIRKLIEDNRHLPGLEDIPARLD